MTIKLRKIKQTDIKFFAKWWRDRELLKLTSGMLKKISDKDVEKYFSAILKDKKNLHFLITLDQKVIGHISLVRARKNWYETQIIIGDKRNRGKGYGVKAIKILIRKAKRSNISKIFLEVRPDNLRAVRAYEKSGFKKSGLKKYPKNKYLPITLKMELEN